ncbi:MAG TPA: acyl-[ACP]--phospholipid O-acyltransferase [Vicinamibacterales bacterium]|nr:acyl-[ACP]--phospholipid O-acyltransferase [Vicinamibacterales bacterium]
MASGSYRKVIGEKGFQPFLWTQFLGAFNDNLFKIVVSMLAVRMATGAQAGRNLSLVGAIFILPFLLFSGYAGQLADVYSKRTVLIVTKSLEILTAALALGAFAAGHLGMLFVALFLFALQATFFSPAKYGILPEMLPDRDLSRANGLLEMSTFVAIVAGTAIGSYMLEVWKAQLWLVGASVVAIAVIGSVASFGIPRVPASSPGSRIRLNPAGEIVDGLKRLRRDRVLWLTVIGISYFWFLGALLQLVTVLFGAEVLRLDGRWVGLLTAFAAIGIGAGSVVAGRLSGDKVELGLAPLGSIGMGAFAVFLSRCTTPALAAFNLTMVGFFAGLFAVPLNALLQQKSGEQERGRLMATNNFLNMVGVMLASAALWLCSSWLSWGADRIFLVFGLLTLASSIYVLSVVPEFTIRFSLWLFTHTVYRIRIEGQENVPSRGPALLVCNHVSHVDGFLVGSCVQRFVRFMVYRPYYELKGVNPLLRMMKAIPVSAGSRREMVASLERAREELRQGHVVCIFAEGSISRTGNLLPFKRGFERIVEGLDAPVIPVYLDRVWGSIFSFKGGRFFWKWPVRVPYPVTVAFGRPMPSSTSASEARLAMLELGCEVALARRPGNETLGRQFVRTAKRQWSSLCMADSSGKRLTFGRALAAGLLLSRWIRKRARGEQNVGVLLPSTVGGALANVATSLAGKVPVNLNFTSGAESMGYAVAQCDIKTILTSRVFLSKASIEPTAAMVYLEDVMPLVTRAAAIRMFALAFVLPVWALNRLFLGDTGDADSTAAIIFSSGSTGVPKGVVLTHRNILANIDSVGQVFEVTGTDVLLGVLPFFHSFGFTGTLWFPLIAGIGVVYHPNPMDGKTIGELAGRYSATFLMSTPTFCASYVRKCPRGAFARLRYAMVGAEKLREPVAKAFREKFGLDLLEGYGCTEMAPIVAANVPDITDRGERQLGVKAGSVGQPLPGVAVKVVDVETGEGPLIGKEGLLLVKGPNRMAGYLGDPDRTREALRDGWYVTGDIAMIDEDGFIFITDRLSRFSKIAGEMVPHLKIEDALAAVLGAAACVVTAVPDETRGERLVVFHTSNAITSEQLWARLSESELPKLWIPKLENVYYIDAIPALGTGKVDLKRVRTLALETTAEKALARA